MRSLLPIGVALCVVVVAGLGVAAAADGTGTQQSGVVIEDVGVAPSTPTPGDEATVQVTITNEGDETIELSSLSVRSQDPLTEHGRNRNPGVISPGTTRTIEVDVTFEETDFYEVDISVSGSVAGQQFTRELERQIPVRERGPTVVFDADDPVEGAETTVELTVANGERDPVRNVRITLDGPGVTVEDPVRVAPQLAPGERTTFTYTVVPNAAGEQRLTAQIDFVESNDQERTVRDVSFLDVSPLQEDASLSVTTTGGGPRPLLQAELINLGNAPLTDVVFTVRTDDGTAITQRAGPDVAADGSRTVPINITGVDTANLTVEAAYRTGTVDGTASDTTRYSANPGQIELTGIEVQQQPGQVLIRGDASNVGLSNANGVLISVADADGVSPTQPSGEFFVGDVPASDFAQFELTASVEDGRDTVPVQVEYVAEDERITKTVEVDVGGATQVSTPPQEATGESGGGDGIPGFGLVAGLAALILVVGLAAVGYRVR